MKNSITTGQLLFSVFYLLLWPAIFLYLSGDWYWFEGWVFGVWFLGTTTTIMVYMYLKDPALLAERFRKQGTGNQQPWDKFFFFFIALFFMMWVAVIPLESKRLSWTTEFPSWLKIIGLVLLLLSSFFLYRAFADNTFLSPLIRIQTERKQQLVTTGVYAIIRHPMYLGGILMFVGSPLLMGSYIGLGLSPFLILTLALRTLGEEKMMMQELEGYERYKKDVPYRFIPGIW
jgi:protein-S-isoprenylcysteine O-methyltransferase Ste14